MTTLMRCGRDRRSGKPVKCHARKERALLVGTRSANHIRAGGHSGCTQRPNTWLHPNASRKRQIPLASRAPSIHGMDEVHVAFTHQPGGSHAKLSGDLPIITAEETDWGMLRFGTRKTGKVRQTLHYAPNVTRVIVPPLAGMDGVGGWSEIYFSFNPGA